MITAIGKLEYKGPDKFEYIPPLTILGAAGIQKPEQSPARAGLASPLPVNPRGDILNARPLTIWEAAGLQKPGQPLIMQVDPTGATGAPQVSKQFLAVGLTADDLHDSASLQQRFAQTLGNINVDPKQAVALATFATGQAKCVSDVVKIYNPSLLPSLAAPLTGLAVIAGGADVWKAISEKDTAKIVIKGALLGANFIDLLATTGVVPGGTNVQLACIVLKAVDNTYEYYCKTAARQSGSDQRYSRPQQ